MEEFNRLLKMYHELRDFLNTMLTRYKAGTQFLERDASGRLVDNAPELIANIEQQIRTLDSSISGLEQWLKAKGTL
jgi:hypothetical protein